MKDYLKKTAPKFYIALSGILLGISVVFTELGALSYLALIPLAFTVLSKTETEDYTYRKAYLDGCVFFMSYYLVSFHWFLYFYPLDFTGMSRMDAVFVVALAWIGVPLFQSVFSAVVFVFICFFSKSGVYKKYKLIMPFFASALFAVNEWSQTLTWAGVPWARIAISQTSMPLMMQTASLFGSYFLTFIIVLFNFLVAYAIKHAEKRRFTAFLAVGILLANLFVGTALYFVPVAQEDNIRIAALQGNLPSWEDRGLFFDGVYDTYEKLTLEAAAEGAELIVWPEGVFVQDIKGIIKGSNGNLVYADDELSSLARRCGAAIVLGTCFKDGNGDVYNSISVFYPDGTSELGVYSKIKLVPFGEFLPFASVIETVVPVLGMINTLPETLSSGKGATVFGSSSGGEGISLGTMICFDSVYESLAMDCSRAGAEIFLIPSDDSWFYGSRALDMHHAQNILRAVEQGRYTVNCGNTGITSIVTDKGEIISDMPAQTEGYIIDTVYASSNRTLYSYIGNTFVYMCVAFIALVLAKEIFTRIKNVKNQGYN